ncbi:putative oxidoreductase-like protein [Golovinomyces cichoracearum]|uniref:Putative oxidoreductase-like protein n=1 Tax=Golovinomyces cichoracearum TaxID=62708 RepID=A0A420IJ97_9PEZI|nr:putative oxidoreductase-like protein [Golovinomyces cichoracearum]
MAVCVEANSLSEITQIASNPPNFPRNPAGIRRESLTLYISRVPGSEDIILSTLRPLTKNVTAEDVTTCLYYLHVNSERDSKNFEEKSRKSPVEPNSQTSMPQPPPSRYPNVSNNSPKSNAALDSPNQKTQSIRRKPVPGSLPSIKNQASQAHWTSSRPPLTHRVSSTTSTIERKPLPGTEIDRDASQDSASQPNAKNFQDSYPPGNIAAPYVESERSKEEFNVTIVRRDPSSGAQWNVGTIFGHPVIEEEQKRHQYSLLAKKPYYDMTLSLTTPGYIRFKNQNFVDGETPPLAPRHSTLGIQSSGYSFDRKLLMEGSSFWSRASAQRRRAISDFSERYCKPGGFQLPGVSDHSADSKDNKGKGYVFISPWGGRCKFLTGSGGRSLRCFHTLPPPISANPAELQQPVTVSELRFNLPVSVMAYSTYSQGPSGNPRVFSDFNLAKIQKKINRLKLTQAPLNIRSRSALSYNARLGDEENLIRTQSQSITAYGEDERLRQTYKTRNSLDVRPSFDRVQDLPQEPVDPRIGREKAGGGKRGNHAKLGKLIIYDEGLKMLDLIISANMAIWWSVKEF